MSYPNPEQTPMGWEPPTGTPSGSTGPAPGQPFDPPPPGFPGGGSAGHQGAPAGYPGVPAAAPRRRRRWPWVVLGVVVLLGLLIGGCSVLLLRAVSPSIDAANEWMALVDEQRWDEAYGELCSSTQESQGADAVVPVLRQDFGDGITDYRLSQYQNNNGNVSIGGQVEIDGRDRSITLAMSDADGTWRVCRYTFSAIDAGP